MSILLQDWSFLTSMAYLNLSWGFFITISYRSIPVMHYFAVQAPAATRRLARMSASPPEVQSYGKIQVHRGPPLFLMVCKRQLKKAVIVWIPGLPMYRDKTYCTMADSTFGGWETRSACGTVGDDATFDVLILHVLQQPQNLLLKTAAIV